MKKRLWVCILMITLAMMFTACQSTSEESVKGTESLQGAGTNAPEGTGKDQEEIVEIIWQYPTSGNLGAGFQDMEDALNEMMERDIGVHVTFEPVGLGEAQQKATLMVSGGEQLDLCMSAFAPIAPLASSNLVLPLTDLIDEYGKDIKDLGADLGMGYYNGDLYGIPPVGGSAGSWCYLIKTEYLEKYQIETDPDKFYTFEELEKIFEVIKAGEGDNFYCLPVDQTIAPVGVYMEYDAVGGTPAAGVLMLNKSFDDLTLCNLYETDEYRNYAEIMYRWAQNGYISPDAAVSTETTDTLVAKDNYLGTFYFGNPLSEVSYASTVGKELTKLKVMERYYANNGGLSCLWSIPITSAHPEKALEALNYIYANDDANWIIQYGLEGQSYEIVEQTDEGTQIRFLSDNMEELPYFNPYGLWGNQYHYAAVEPTPVNANKLIEDYHRGTPKERYSPAMGYSFVRDSVSTEIASLSTVIEQYDKMINCGALDPQKAVPEFISALKAAGIEEVIAENQRQLDEWAAAQK